MRKIILPALVAGVVALTASQVFAAGAVVKGEFTENHAYKGAFGAGTTSELVSENPYSGSTITNTPTLGGNHYKFTDFVENGRHGFQLSSSILKSVASETEGFKADDAVGFVTGANPFATGGIVGESEWPMEVPKYTSPCPEWVDGDLDIKTPGDCPANDFATDPQTEDNAAIWDGVVLDDLYQAVGAVDNFEGVRTFGIAAGQYTDETRSLDQALDILFYNGKRGGIQIANSTVNTVLQDGTGDGVGNKRHMNITQTLDQDIADWVTIYHGITKDVADRDETMGIYGKLTQVYQNAGTVSSVTGCGSMGAMGTDDNGPSLCASDPNFLNTEGAAWRVEDQGSDLTLNGGSGATIADWSAFVIDQWIVSDVYDWHHRGDSDTVAYDADKERGFGIQQSYSSWFRDGDQVDWDITHEYDMTHGTTAGTVGANADHNEHPDP